jgi:hypothetical protein
LTPLKHVRLELLTASASSPLINIEKHSQTRNSTGKAYTCHRNISKTANPDPYSSQQNQMNPSQNQKKQAKKKPFYENPHGLFLTSPSLALSMLFEKKLDTSFTETALNHIRAPACG